MNVETFTISSGLGSSDSGREDQAQNDPFETSTFKYLHARAELQRALGLVADLSDEVERDFLTRKNGLVGHNNHRCLPLANDSQEPVSPLLLNVVQAGQDPDRGGERALQRWRRLWTTQDHCMALQGQKNLERVKTPLMNRCNPSRPDGFRCVNRAL